MSDGTNNENLAAACFFGMRRATSELRQEWMEEYALDVETEVHEERDMNSMKQQLESLLKR